MDIVIYLVIGLCMGVLGGMLGIGGSVFMIPAMTLAFDENQHLYQAAAMICNFFVASSSMLAHRKAEAWVKSVLLWLVPAAIVGIFGGVMLSNAPVFEGEKSYLLARAFGIFLVYVVIYNSYRLYLHLHPKIEVVSKSMPPKKIARVFSVICGAITGLAAGLLGIGAGTVATPLQQVTLKLPLKNAMSNSAVTIVCISWLGAIYKNATLAQHGIAVADSLKIAAWVIPGAVVGGFIGGHLMHTLPKNIVRGIFIGVCLMAAIKLLTVTPN
mgnify:FL=1